MFASDLFFVCGAVTRSVPLTLASVLHLPPRFLAAWFLSLPLSSIVRTTTLSATSLRFSFYSGVSLVSAASRPSPVRAGEESSLTSILLRLSPAIPLATP